MTHEQAVAAMAALRATTAPALMLERAAQTPDGVAYRAKKLGIYQERTWRGLTDEVGRVAAGFKALGLQAGQRVAIIGDACEEWLLADLAAQSAGAITFGIYPTASPSEVAYQLGDAQATLVICEDQEYVDKIMPALDRLPDLSWIVVVDTTAMFTYRHPRLVTWDAVRANGDADGGLAAMVALLRPEDPAFIVYTSGTTGHPKGALVSHGRHLAGCYTLVDRYPELARPGQTTVVYLPLCHVLGRDAAITLPLICGLMPHFGEDPEDLPRTLFEVAPTVLFTVPRYLQKFASQVLVGIAETTPLKRAVHTWAMRIGRACAKRRWQGGGASSGLAYRLAWQLAFRPILNKLGFDRLRLVISGGAPLAPETTALWHVFGVNVVEIYGQTETAGAIIAGQQGPFPRPGDVGTVPAGWEVRLDPESGEILVRSDDLFDGYWHNPEATAQVVDAQGWLHTGDVGRWDDRRLRLIDRARDFIVTAGGKTLSPSHIENALRSSPYVSEAVVFGHNRKYITALLEIDHDAVAAWARGRGIAYTGFASLVENPGVQGLIRTAIGLANAELARVEQIKAFRILPKTLDPEEEGEPVTPTRKVKRTQMYERFKDLVEAMYGHDEEELIAREVGDLLAPG